MNTHRRIHLRLRQSRVKLVLVPGHQVQLILLRVLHWQGRRTCRGEQCASLDAVSVHARLSLRIFVFEGVDLRDDLRASQRALFASLHLLVLIQGASAGRLNL